MSTFSDFGILLLLLLQLFYCPATGQQFDSYFALMHYVKYAMRNKLSIYEPCYKAVKRIKNLKKRDRVKKSRKTLSVLSLRGKQPTQSTSAIAEQPVDSASIPSKSSKNKEDSDFHSELYPFGTAEELEDSKSDDSASD
ncbi:hypothetical protein Lalb_Chr10g0097301 [Lupinus albus]|uniref:Uncharacterized protein n=1 Tax=Lupinus albus TaxID=3870 RepID=A0A6A4PVY1_LUPAL|nr:hypothetical protein Lalb_Chr10g0097301 [Lupinus albus]